MNKNVPKLRFKEFSDEWKEMRIGETLKIKHGKDQKKVIINNGKYPILGTGGEIGRTNEFLYDKESVLIGRKGTIDKPRFMNTPFWTVDTLFYSEIKKGFEGKFLYYGFQKINWKKYCEATGVPSLSASTIESIKYYIPSKEEQERIGNFFSIIDKLIEEEEGKVRDLELYKKGMMQKIFKQEIRFKDDNGLDYPAWEESLLKKYIVDYNETTKVNNQYEVLTSSRKGLFLQKDYFNKQIASEDNTGYTIVPRGYFTYRHMSDDSIFYFNINDLLDYGIVSTLYPVFTTNKDMNSLFLKYYLNESLAFRKYCLLQKQGGSRTYMYLKKLKEFKGEFPCLEEQIKIANILSNIDNLKEEEQKNLDDLREMKKGLLQQMFV